MKNMGAKIPIWKDFTHIEGLLNTKRAQNRTGLLFWNVCALLLQLLIKKDEKDGMQNTNMKKILCINGLSQKNKPKIHSYFEMAKLC